MPIMPRCSALTCDWVWKLHPFYVVHIFLQNIRTMYVSCIEYLSFSILNLSLLHIYRRIKYSQLNMSLNLWAQLQTPEKGSFCFILSIKLDHYYLLTLIKRCTSSSEISFDLISCRKSIKLKRNKAPGTRAPGSSKTQNCDAGNELGRDVNYDNLLLWHLI